METNHKNKKWLCTICEHVLGGDTSETSSKMQGINKQHVISSYVAMVAKCDKCGTINERLSEDYLRIIMRDPAAYAELVDQLLPRPKPNEYVKLSIT